MRISDWSSDVCSSDLDEGVVLRTDRLILRPHILGDFEDSFDMWSDPTTTEFIGGHPSTREECWSRFLRYVGMWPILGFGYWAIMERDTQTFVGEIGCAEFKRDIVPPISLPESGWAITRRRSEEHTSELQSLMRISYAVFCLKQK